MTETHRVAAPPPAVYSDLPPPYSRDPPPTPRPTQDFSHPQQSPTAQNGGPQQPPTHSDDWSSSYNSGPAGQPTAWPSTSSAVAATHPTWRHSARADASAHADGSRSIEGTFYLDPDLRKAGQPTLTSAANSVLSGLGGLTSPDDAFAGVARLARKKLLPPDGKFEAADGGVSLHLGVVDAEGAGSDGKPHTARVQINTRGGGVEADIIMIDANRQLRLIIETVTGDVLVLLPSSFEGAIHVTAPKPPLWGPALAPVVGRVAQHEGTYSATIVPGPQRRPSISLPASPTSSGLLTTTADSSVMKKLGHYAPRIPAMLRDADTAMNDYGARSYASANHSKITIKTHRGSVLIGYRNTADYIAAVHMGIKVGAARQKSWWQRLV